MNVDNGDQINQLVGIESPEVTGTPAEIEDHLEPNIDNSDGAASYNTPTNLSHTEAPPHDNNMPQSGPARRIEETPNGGPQHSAPQARYVFNFYPALHPPLFFIRRCSQNIFPNF